MRLNRLSAAAAARKPRVPRAMQTPFWCSRGVRAACGSRAVAAADSRFDRICVQRLTNVPQRCGWIDRPPPQRLANR
eukprot:6872754-Lingulodinium_polyedra.AAC.1